MTLIRLTVGLIAFAWLSPWAASAQKTGSAHAGASGGAEIELGATRPTQVELGAGRTHSGPRATDHARIALQGRFNALNMLNFTTPDVPNSHVLIDGLWLFVPMVTPGVRLVQNKLFLGLGLGMGGVKVSNGPTETSRTGWSLSPLVSYDILSDQLAALSLLGWLNLAHLGESETCVNNNCNSVNNDIMGWGAGLGAGLRGFITQGLALGSEFGWSFLSLPQDNGPDSFVHGLFGNIFLEASIEI